jgi:hypothetical protein
MGLLILLLGILAVLIPAPLRGPADVASVPNPIKSAWFLLWTQELVSYSKHLIYPVMLLGICFLFLPYFSGSPEFHGAGWLPRDQWVVNILTLMALVGILALTVVAAFFRGENWALVCNF